MSNTITKDQVEKIIKIAKLILSDAEKEQLTVELSKTVDYVAILSDLNVANIQPTFQTNNLSNVFREDTVKPTLTQDQALSNAPKAYQGFFSTKPLFDKE